MNDVRSVRSGTTRAHLFNGAKENVRATATLHALQDRGGSVLEGNIHVGANLFVGCDGFEQLAGDLVGIGVEEAHPT